jgi:hypothetical protein
LKNPEKRRLKRKIYCPERPEESTKSPMEQSPKRDYDRFKQRVFVNVITSRAGHSGYFLN